MKDGFGVSLTSALGLSWGKQNHGEHGKAQCLILMIHIYLQGEGSGGRFRGEAPQRSLLGQAVIATVAPEDLGTVRPQGGTPVT